MLKVKRLTDTAKLPTRAYAGDAGLDLYADENWLLSTASRALINTNIIIAIPDGKVLVTNSGDDDYAVHRGDKIAQLLIQPVSLMEPVEVDALDASERNGGGFGSSGL